jgi:hypothetical protein
VGQHGERRAKGLPGELLRRNMPELCDEGWYVACGGRCVIRDTYRVCPTNSILRKMPMFSFPLKRRTEKLSQ